MAIKTIIVDDHPVVRFGVKQMLSSSEDIEVAAEMDKTVHHVRAMCSRALARLREILRPDHVRINASEVKHVDD